MAKFGGHGLRHFASRLANVIRQEGRGGREGGREGEREGGEGGRLKI